MAAGDIPSISGTYSQLYTLIISTLTYDFLESNLYHFLLFTYTSLVSSSVELHVAEELLQDFSDFFVLYLYF